MCTKTKSYWVIVDRFGFEVSDCFGNTYKFKTEQDANNYLNKHESLADCRVAESTNGIF